MEKFQHADVGNFGRENQVSEQRWSFFAKCGVTIFVNFQIHSSQPILLSSPFYNLRQNVHELVPYPIPHTPKRSANCLASASTLYRLCRRQLPECSCWARNTSLGKKLIKDYFELLFTLQDKNMWTVPYNLECLLILPSSEREIWWRRTMTHRKLLVYWFPWTP